MSKLRQKSNRGVPSYPSATVAFYGPTNLFATKIAAAVFAAEGAEPILERWISDGTDIRFDPAIGAQVTAFVKAQGASSVTMTDGIIGCPHEEGIDYPEGESCPQCPYWAGRDRFAYERSQ